MSEIAQIRLEAGRVKAFSASGTFLRKVGEANVTSCQIHNDNVSITYWNGKTKLYDKQGNFLKNI